MLEKVKKAVFTVMYNYHQKMADYYYGKIDWEDSSDKQHWTGKTTEHMDKAFELFDKLEQMGEA